MDDISKKIRGLRIQKGLTLKELSEKTDLSVSFLSQVERGASSLTITSLKKIADALGVKMTYFFETPENEQYAVRKEEQQPFRLEGSESVYTRLAGQFSGRTLEPMKVILPPKHKQTAKFHHPGEEFYYVLKGAVRIYVAQEVYHLREGDAIHFPSQLSHYWENPLDEPATILCVLTPVIFN